MFLLLLFFKSVEQQLEISLMTAEEQEKEGKFLQVVFFFLNQAIGNSTHALKFLFSLRFSSCIVDNIIMIRTVKYIS